MSTYRTKKSRPKDHINTGLFEQYNFKLNRTNQTQFWQLISDSFCVYTQIVNYSEPFLKKEFENASFFMYKRFSSVKFIYGSRLFKNQIYKHINKIRVLILRDNSL